VNVNEKILNLTVQRDEALARAQDAEYRLALTVQELAASRSAYTSLLASVEGERRDFWPLEATG
jgi:hypothetical protein